MLTPRIGNEPLKLSARGDLIINIVKYEISVYNRKLYTKFNTTWKNDITTGVYQQIDIEITCKTILYLCSCVFK
jgi:hypothetical protein